MISAAKLQGADPGNKPAPGGPGRHHPKPGAVHGAQTAPKSAAIARIQKRHYVILLSFLLAVIVPFAASVFYMFAVADDQYASVTGFTVRSEQTETAAGLLGGLASLSGASSSDTDILYQFIQSRSIVEKIDKNLNLRAMFSRPTHDPVFAFDPNGSFEDLVSYWQRMVTVSQVSGSSLLEVQVNAFSAADAHAIAETIVTESSLMINELSAIAREDATRYATQDLELSVERLKAAREALTKFRSETRIVDPKADIQGQMGLLSSLEGQLAEAIIASKLLLQTVRDTDPRVEEARRRIDVIETLIDQERQKFGMGSGAKQANGDDYSTLVGEFERLTVDLEYAQKSFLAAQALRDSAEAEALRKSRYLATYDRPSLPETAEYPRRFELSAVAGAVLLLIWAVGILIYYSLRDRR